MAKSCASGCVSSTVTKNVQLFVLPELSVTVQVTGVTPVAKKEPEAGSQTTLATPQLSSTAGSSNVTMAPPSPSPAMVKTSLGQVIVGGTDSVMVTVKEQKFVPFALLA